MAARAVQLGVGHSLGAWSPRAILRARARLPKVVLEAVARGEAVPAALGSGAGGARHSALGRNGKSAGGAGGAGGAVAVSAIGDRDRTCPNLRVRMTGRGHVAPGGSWIEDADGEPRPNGTGANTPHGVEATTDLADRAHREYRGELLASGRAAMHAVPRQYHKSYMVGPASRRVSVETAIERVEACAHACGLHRGPSMGEAVASVLVRADAAQVRSVVRGTKLKEHYGESEADREEAAAFARHERAVAALLAAAGGGA